MANFYRYFFIMPSLARFELEMHERVERGEALTADYLNELMADLMSEVYGAEVELPATATATRVGCTWAQFHTHLYSNFYVYQYATGIAGAQLARRAGRWRASRAPPRLPRFHQGGGSLVSARRAAAGGRRHDVARAGAQGVRGDGRCVDRLEELLAARTT